MPDTLIPVQTQLSRWPQSVSPMPQRAGERPGLTMGLARANKLTHLSGALGSKQQVDPQILAPPEPLNPWAGVSGASWLMLCKCLHCCWGWGWQDGRGSDPLPPFTCRSVTCCKQHWGVEGKREKLRSVQVEAVGFLQMHPVCGPPQVQQEKEPRLAPKAPRCRVRDAPAAGGQLQAGPGGHPAPSLVSG